MRHPRIILAGLVVCLGLTAIGFQAAQTPGGQMKTFADSFLESLETEQRAEAVVPYDSDQRVNWHFVPRPDRKGLVLSEMNTAQRTAALRLLRAALSEAGYGKASKIMQLEAVLRALEGDDRNWARDPEMYYVTLFGKPSDSEPWGLSFEGHHLSLNFVCRDGQVVDSTPQFMGANPATVMSDVQGMLGKGTRVLRDEEQLAFDLVNSLSGSQADVAVLNDTPLDEIRFAGDPQPTVDEPVGIPYKQLSEAQQQQLQALVAVYTDTVPGAVAKQRRDLIEKNGWDKVYFAWAGATKPGIGHYYRIRGTEFLIEFVNTQADPAGNPANHIHAVFRDLSGDFDLPVDQ